MLTQAVTYHVPTLVSLSCPIPKLLVGLPEDTALFNSIPNIAYDRRENNTALGALRAHSARGYERRPISK
jgi:hypothetical protein